MYCVQCGKDLPDDANFCLQCGTPQRSDKLSAARVPRWETGVIFCEAIDEVGFFNPKIVLRLGLEATGPQGIYVAAEREFETELREYICAQGQRMPYLVVLDGKDKKTVAVWTKFVAELSKDGWDRVLGTDEWPGWQFRRLVV